MRSRKSAESSSLVAVVPTLTDAKHVTRLLDLHSWDDAIFQ